MMTMEAYFCFLPWQTSNNSCFCCQMVNNLLGALTNYSFAVSGGPFGRWCSFQETHPTTNRIHKKDHTNHNVQEFRFQVVSSRNAHQMTRNDDCDDENICFSNVSKWSPLSFSAWCISHQCHFIWNDFHFEFCQYVVVRLVSYSKLSPMNWWRRLWDGLTDFTKLVPISCKHRDRKMGVALITSARLSVPLGQSHSDLRQAFGKCVALKSSILWEKLLSYRSFKNWNSHPTKQTTFQLRHVAHTLAMHK